MTVGRQQNRPLYGFETSEGAGAIDARAGWNRDLPGVEALRRALAISGQQLQDSRRKFEMLLGRYALLKQKVGLLEHDLAKAHQYAYRDELTGLPNRRLLLDRFTQVVARGVRQHHKAVLLFIDLDGFKRINDDYGHAVGDKVLEQVSARLADCIRASDTVCRYGGDEFVILLPEIENHEHALIVMAKIRAQLALPYPVGHSPIAISASIGMAVYPIDGCELGDLIRVSDREMYRDKARLLAQPSEREHIGAKVADKCLIG